MSTEKMSVGANVFESEIGGVSVRAKAHSLSAWFVPRCGS